jgi:hypothetical protein
LITYQKLNTEDLLINQHLPKKRGGTKLDKGLFTKRIEKLNLLYSKVLVWSAICKLALVDDCRPFILITPGIEFLVDLAMIPRLVFCLYVAIIADRVKSAEKFFRRACRRQSIRKYKYTTYQRYYANSY